jgi:hypothetical protein
MDLLTAIAALLFPLFPLLAVLALLALAALAAWRWMAGRRRALPEGAAWRWMAGRRRALPEDAAPLRLPQTPHRPATGAGGLMLVGSGTFGAMEAQRLLTVLAASGLERLVGSVLIIENDADVLATFRQQTPAIYADRIVYAATGAFAKGMSSQPIAAVQDQAELWQLPVEAAAERVADLHQRRNGAAAAPGLILVSVAGGGHAPLAIPAVAALHRRFPQVVMLGSTVLPAYTRLRERFAELKPRYEAAGVRGWLLADNLIPDQTTADHGRAALLAGLAEAAQRADQPAALNNALLNALPEAPGGIALFQTAVMELPAYPAGGRDPRYYTWRQPLVDTLLRARRALAAGDGRWSVDAPVRAARSITLDLLVTNVAPAALTEVGDQVRTSLLTALPGRQWPADYDLQLASLALPLDPARPICQVMGIRLVAAAPEATVEALAALPPDRPWAAASRHDALAAD